MSTNNNFIEHDHDALIKIIEDCNFATLVSQTPGDSVVSHLPLLFESYQGKVFLNGHMAKSNQLWQSFNSEIPLLVIFNGPQQYISPTWSDTGVPTWNYAVVHARGFATVLDESSTIEVIRKLTEKHEKRMDRPWHFNLTPQQKQKISKQVVGFSIEVTDLSGRFKLSQNQPKEVREKIIDELEKYPNAQALSDLMKSQV